MKNNPILPTSLFSDFCTTTRPPHPCLLQHTPPLFFLLFCFFGWMGDNATIDVPFYLMMIWIYTCRPLVPYYQKDLDVCFKFTKVWHIMWFFSGTLIWYHTHKKTKTHTAYINIYSNHLLYAHSSHLYYIKWLNE